MAEETRLAATADVARLRADIETTRAAMSDTLTQIQERLNPARLKEQARQSVRDATIGRVKQMARNAGNRANEAGRGVVDVVRENPLPLALIGIGAGWLLMNSRRRSQVEYHHEVLLTERTPIGYESGYTHEGHQSTDGEGVVERARDTIGHTAHSVADKATDLRERAGERVDEVSQRLSERVSDVGGTVRSAASSVAHRVGGVASGLGARVSETAGSIRERSRSAATRASYQYQETPWLGAAVAIGLGVAAGLAIPGTERENELLGERRDELLNRARELGREKVDSIRTVASEVVADTKEAVRESVREHAQEEGLVEPTDNQAGA